MLATILGLLTGKTKIKFTALVSAASLLVFDLLDLLEIPQSEIGAWFHYGLFVSVWALLVSLGIDCLILIVENIRKIKKEEKERFEQSEKIRESIIGSFKSLNKSDLFYVLDVYFDPSRTKFVELKDYSLTPTPYANLLDQRVLRNAGTSKIRPRVVVDDYVAEKIEENFDSYYKFWESGGG